MSATVKQKETGQTLLAIIAVLGWLFAILLLISNEGFLEWVVKSSEWLVEGVSKW